MERNPFLEQLLSRYPEHQGFWLDEGKLGRDKEAFLCRVLSLFENPELFVPEDFSSFQPELLVDYIRKTHQMYLSKRIPEMEQQLLLLKYDAETSAFYALFQLFKVAFYKHITAEETQFLPYLDRLVQAGKESRGLSSFLLQENSFRMADFVHHDQAENPLCRLVKDWKALSDTKLNESPGRILTLQLEMFEKDLHVHDLIEDRVLIPLACDLEDAITHRLTLLSDFN